jgi:hypothetical protein
MAVAVSTRFKEAVSRKNRKEAGPLTPPLPRRWSLTPSDLYLLIGGAAVLIGGMWVRHGGASLFVDPIGAIAAVGQLTALYGTLLALVGILLLLSTHGASLLHLRWVLGKEEAQDGVPFHLCALSQTVAWGQLLLLLLHDIVSDGPMLSAARSYARVAVAVRCSAIIAAASPYQPRASDGATRVSVRNTAADSSIS